MGQTLTAQVADTLHHNQSCLFNDYMSSCDVTKKRGRSPLNRTSITASKQVLSNQESSSKQLSLFSIPAPTKTIRKSRKVKPVLSNHVQLSLWTDTTLVSPDENLLLHFWVAMTHRDNEQLLRVNTAMTQYWTDEQYMTLLSTVKPFLEEEEEFWLISLLRGV